MKSNNAISKIGQSWEIYTFSPNLASATKNGRTPLKLRSSTFNLLKALRIVGRYSDAILLIALVVFG